MKKLIYTAGAVLVMLASASCKKNETVKEPQPSVEMEDMVFTATAANGSGLKTTIVDGTKAVWSSSDNLKVFTAEDQTGSVCNYKSGAGTATAEFEGQCAKKGPWTAICPAIDGATYSAGTITFTMPATQTYAANTFADGAMPCVAYSETNTFNFKHSFGVLKLSLKLVSGKTGSVKSIKVTDKGGAKLNGTFTVNPQTGAAATYSTGGTSSVTLNCTSVALSTSTATDFWIVVPAGAFASGFDVTVTSTNDIETALSTAKANTIKAGEVNKMPVQTIEFVVPTTGYAAVKAEAGIPGNQVKWVQLWKDGPKWAEFNVGSDANHNYDAYYCWGGTYKSTKNSFECDPYDDGEGEDIQYTEHDTAKTLWGPKWQMPTGEDFEYLLDGDKCFLEWTDNYKGTGKAGMLFKGKGDYAENSVFLPAAGYLMSGNLLGLGRGGHYCMSSGFAYFDSYYANYPDPNIGNSACSLRAILHE